MFDLPAFIFKGTFIFKEINGLILENGCPNGFTPIGRKCYYFSEDKANWQDSHFECLKINSTLAILSRAPQESLVRSFLNRHVNAYGRHERWIDGIRNWATSKWIWGASGKPLKFHAFSRMNPNLKSQLSWHCICLDPLKQNKWSAKSCLEKKQFICQTITNFHLKVKSQLNNNHIDNCTNFIDPNEKKLCKEYLYNNNIKKKKHSNEPATLVHTLIVRNLTKKPIKDFICPSHMILVGRKCYFFSTNSLTWNEAYWACRDNKTKLAIINNKQQDNILRGFLNRNFIEKHERWIGGIYDWKQNKWKWAINGITIKYKNFIKHAPQDKNWNSITLDPQYNHQWNFKKQSEKKHFICQSKAKSVGK